MSFKSIWNWIWWGNDGGKLTASTASTAQSTTIDTPKTKSKTIKKIKSTKKTNKKPTAKKGRGRPKKK